MSQPQNVDLRAQIVNIALMEGDAWSILTRITGYDLTGATVDAYLKPRAGELIELDVSVSDADSGEFYVGQDVVTVGGLYDVQVTPLDGLPRTYVRGRLSVTADVTPDGDES